MALTLCRPCSPRTPPQSSFKQWSWCFDFPLVPILLSSSCSPQHNSDTRVKILCETKDYNRLGRLAPFSLASTTKSSLQQANDRDDAPIKIAAPRLLPPGRTDVASQPGPRWGGMGVWPVDWERPPAAIRCDLPCPWVKARRSDFSWLTLS